MRTPGFTGEYSLKISDAPHRGNRSGRVPAGRVLPQRWIPIVCDEDGNCHPWSPWGSVWGGDDQDERYPHYHGDPSDVTTLGDSSDDITFFDDGDTIVGDPNEGRRSECRKYCWGLWGVWEASCVAAAAAAG